MIPARFRAALCAKGALLVALAALFVWLGVAAWARGHWPVTARILVGALVAVIALFLAWAAALALLDALLGQALRASGAVPLVKRRSGYSLRLPSGRYVEYLLYNTWQSLEQGACYSVVYGRHSGVLVRPPEREHAPSTLPRVR